MPSLVGGRGSIRQVRLCGEWGRRCSYSVAMYTINATTGALTSIGTIAAGTALLSVAVDPSGKFAYVANWTYDSER